MTGKDIIKILKSEGWILDRVNGSHHIMTKEGRAVPIPVHGNKYLGKSLIGAIEKQTGVKFKK